MVPCGTSSAVGEYLSQGQGYPIPTHLTLISSRHVSIARTPGPLDALCKRLSSSSPPLCQYGKRSASALQSVREEAASPPPRLRHWARVSRASRRRKSSATFAPWRGGAQTVCLACKD